MKMDELDMPRVIAAGGKNPNTNTVYVNLEEKIKEAIDRNDGKLPVTSLIGPNLTVIDPTDVIGYVRSVDELRAHVTLTASGLELLKRGVLFGQGIQFCFSVGRETPDAVNWVHKAALGKVGPQLGTPLTDTVVDGAVDVQHDKS